MGESALQLRSNAFLTVPNHGAYDLGTGNFTVEAWILPAGPGTVFARKGPVGGANNGGFLLVLRPGGSLKIATDNGLGYFEATTGNTAAFDGAWHHLAAVRNGPQLLLYLDGNPVAVRVGGNAPPPLNVNNDLGLTLGATEQFQEQYRFYSGGLGEVRLWKTARSQAEIKAASSGLSAAASADPNLLGYWRLDGNLSDAASLRNDARATGAIAFQRPGPPTASVAGPAAPDPQRLALFGPIWGTSLGDGRNTGRSRFAGPAQANVRWRTGIGGKMRGGPVIDGQGNLCVGGEDARLYSLDPNGAVRWTYTGTYPVYYTPAIGPDGTVYAPSDVIFAVTAAGALRWRYERRDLGMIAAAPPKLSADGTTVYVVGQSLIGQPGRLFALDAANGALRWERSFSRGSSSTPAIGPQGTVYVGSEEVALYAYNPDGSLRWRYQDSGDFIRGPVAVDDQGNVYYARMATSPNENALVSLDPNGALRWIYRGGGYVGNPPSIAIAPDGTLYIGFYGMHAVTPAGQRKWATGTAGDIGIYPGNAVVDRTGAVFFGTADNRTFGYSASGAQLWRYDSGSTVGGPALAGDGQLVFSDNGTTVHALQGPLPITGRPTVSATSYDGATVAASWSAVADPGLAGYTLALFQGGTQIQSADVAGTQGTLAANLAAGGTYAVQVRARGTTGLAGPWSDAAPVIAGAPTVAQVSFDGGRVAASWSAVAPGGGGGVTGYRLSVFLGPSPAASQTTAGTAAEVAVALSPASVYTVRVQATGALSTGPWSAPVAVIQGRPGLAAASYDGARVAASWSPVSEGAVTGYRLNVLQGAAQVATAAGAATSAEVAANLAPALACAVQVQATGDRCVGPWSTADLVVARPAVTTVTCDGARAAATWTPVAGADRYVLTLLRGGAETGSASVPGTATGGEIGSTFEPAAAYTVRVRALRGIAAGPASDPAAVVQNAPSLTAVTADLTGATATWSAVAGVDRYVLTLLRGGTETAATLPVTGALTGRINAPLDPAAAYTVRVRAATAQATGPLGAPVPVIQNAPALSAVSYDRTRIAASWTAVAGADRYTVTVLRDGVAVATAAVAGATSGEVPLAFSATGVFTVRVQAAAGVSSGPVSDAVAVLQNPPDLAGVACDGSRVSASWSAVAGADRYTLLVLRGDVTVATLPVTGTSGEVAVALEPAASYTVRVRAGTARFTGPPSAPLAVIASPPSITQVGWDGERVAVSWQAVAGAASYTLRLLRDGDPPGTAVATLGTAGTSAEVAASLAPESSYSVRVRASGDRSTGPESAAAPVVVWRPELSAVAYDGGRIAASWSAAPAGVAATGYALAVFREEERVAQAAAAGTSGEVAVALDPSLSYAVRARAVTASGTGPWSEPLPVLTVSPEPVRLDYDGTALVASWQPVFEPGMTGYAARLLRDGVEVESAAGEVVVAPFRETLRYGARYEAQARATGERTAGPWTPAAPGPATFAVRYRYDNLGRLTGVSIDNSRTTLGYSYDERGNLTAAVVAQTEDAADGGGS